MDIKENSLNPNIVLLGVEESYEPLESEKTSRDSISQFAAEEIAAFNAKASATRAEETEWRVEENVPAGVANVSLKCHPIPQLPEVEFHAAFV